MCLKNSDIHKGIQGKDTQTDSGWAWIVLISAFIENLFLNGAHVSFGIYYKEFLDYFQTSASMISFALSVQTIFISVGSLLVMSIGPRFCSTRTFVMCGGLTGCIAYILNSFAPTVEFLLLSQGFFFGLTHTLVHGPTVVTLGRYFKKKRGLANTLSTMGGSVGGIVLPILVRTLISQYGLQGSLIVVAGLLMNFFVSGALLRPISVTEDGNNNESTDPPPDFSSGNDIKPETEEEGLLTNNSCDSKSTSKSNIEEYERKITLLIQNKSASTSELYVKHDSLFPETVERNRTFSTSSHTRDRSKHNEKSFSVVNKNHQGENSSRELIGSAGGITGSCFISIHNLDSIHNRRPESTPTDPSRMHSLDKGDRAHKYDRRRAFCIEIITRIFDKRVIKNYRFLMYIPVAFTAVIGSAHFLTLLPPHAADIGFTDEEVSYLFMISGISDIISKLFLASVADCHFIKRYQLIAIGLIVFGTATQFISLFTDFKWMAILIVIYGTFGQMYFGLFPVMLADFVGIDNLSTALGIVILVHGLALSVSNPLLGYIRDATGSFVGSFHVMATSLIISGAILLTEPLIRRLEDRNNTKESI